MPVPRPTRLAALAAALLLGGGVIGSALPAGAATPADAAPTHRQSVMLPTGDIVAYDPAHPKDLRVATRVATGPGHAWRSVQSNGHTYVFPLSAAPFLGTVLDTSLFDVTALAASGSPTVHASGTKPALPGLTVTSSGAGSESGRFTRAGAKTFGAALQKAAVAASKGATATRTLFGASAIGTASGTGPIVPHFQQQTVIFKAIGADGKPLADGQIFYGNLDDAARGSDFAYIVDGEVRVSLPAGRFTLFGEADTFTDTSFDSRIVTQPNLAITGAKNRVVTLDFRTATARPSVTLPRAATPRDYTLIYDREWDTGGFGGFYGGDSSGTLELAPAPKPVIGTASLSTYYVATGADGGQIATAFERTGAIPADLHDRVTAGQLAAVHERIADNGSSAFTAFGHGITFADGSGVGEFDSVALPLDRTDYLFAPAGAYWNDGIMLEATDESFGGEIDDTARTYAPGSSTTTDWLRQAIAPQIPRLAPSDIAAGVSCPACRVNGELAVAVIPFQDTAANSHFGFLYDATTGNLFARTRLYRNGTLIDDERGSNLVDAKVPAGKATYQVVADSTPASAGFTLGTAATSTWTFSSAAGAGGTLPAGFDCLVDGAGCRILPLLQVIAPLPADLRGTVGVGAHAFPLRIAPIQGAPATTTVAKVQVSFDDGRTWVTQAVTSHGRNCFRVTLVDPASAAGTTPTLRITGTDAAGDSVVQTITAAYRVAAR